MGNIFDFWSLIKKGENIHPADSDVMNRIQNIHGFDLRCLPSPMVGCLRTAPIILLYLSPGFTDKKNKSDVQEAKSDFGKEYYHKIWTGTEPLPSAEIVAHEWIKSRIKPFFSEQKNMQFNYEQVREKIAILNIGAYHSKDIKNPASLLALPSSQVSLSWAQNYLFPEAEAGKRIVICMRSANYWGLETGGAYGKSLFSPFVTRNGYLENNTQNNKIKELILAKI